MRSEKLEEHINSQIEGLRAKLLDLTLRNPLLSTRLSGRTRAYIRIVDELPDVLVEKLCSGSMRIIALPPLELEPKDEQTREFEEALSNARINDEIYAKELEEIDLDSDDEPERLAKVERDLKDRVRALLGLNPRQTKENLSIEQHAINHNISPSYELPEPTKPHENKYHHDNDIQTLYLPDDLEKRLNGIYSKCNTWLQETGINVLHIAVGFLEWQDNSSTKEAFAPLLLIPIKIEKKLTRGGYIFEIAGQDEEPTENLFLAEKCKREFGLEMPVLGTNESPEEYLVKVSKVSPKLFKKWKVRRQVAIGVFPSNRLAMYKDLDPDKWDFPAHNLICELFGKTSSNEGGVFGDEYEIDEPEIEANVPALISDADSSQFSAIVDIAQGKNLSLEGPPGTGKSQTIVNTIANAVFSGKKILFVADKAAALEVVRSRLEACNMGEFILSLQATRSSREEVIKSIRERREIPHQDEPKELENIISDFKKTRAEISEYISAISSRFGETNLTIYDVLWKNIHTQSLLEHLPGEIISARQPDLLKLSSQKIEEISEKCRLFEISWDKLSGLSSHWENIGVENIDPYLADEILKLTELSIKQYEALSHSLRGFNKFGFNTEPNQQLLSNLKNTLDLIVNDFSSEVPELSIVAQDIIDNNKQNEVKTFMSSLERYVSLNNSLQGFLENPLLERVPSLVTNAIETLQDISLDYLSPKEIEDRTITKKGEEQDIAKAIEVFENVHALGFPENDISLDKLFKICEFIYKTSKSTLAIRNDAFDDPSINEIIHEAEGKAQKLCVIRDKVNKHFVTNPMPEYNDIILRLNVMRSSGIFGFISARNREAKKFYMSISKGPWRNKKSAIVGMRVLAEWVANVNQFNKDSFLEQSLGVHFRGIDTKFEVCKNLLKFYDDINTQYAGITYSELRKFLKDAPLDSLMSLANICHKKNGLQEFLGDNLSSLKLKQEQINREIDKYEKALTRVIASCQVLNKQEGISLQQLKKIRDDVDELQSLSQKTKDDIEIKECLRTLYIGLETDPDKIKKIIIICDILSNLNAPDISVFLKTLHDGKHKDLNTHLEELIQIRLKADESLEKIYLKTNGNAFLFNSNEKIETIISTLNAAALDKEGLVYSSKLLWIKNYLINNGFGGLVKDTKYLKETNLRFSKISKAYINSIMARQAYKIHGTVLSQFNGERLNQTRARLAKLDKEIIYLSRKRLKARLLSSANPPTGNSYGRKSEWTELSLIDNEISKKKRYVTIRDLTKRAGRALQELKPCWMMSPQAVAQYVPKDSVRFDLAIIDEASQMTPENAIGALLRVDQVMVVGDTNQLPPTNFFNKMLNDEEDDDDEKVLQESILELANGAFRPARRLRWHYRSRHPSLIAFSNRYVYNDNLVVFPSPGDCGTTLGISYKKIDGLYKKGTNQIEAKVMVDAILEFMKKHEDLSLGVVVLNQKQETLLKEEWNFILDKADEAKNYIEKWKTQNEGLEYFFIKNLENVQGDERDVIFIGTVYGPEKPGGRVMQRFGPINGAAGKRRLNVLFSRAKKQITTFSSMSSSDILAEETSNQGVWMFKQWIEYSASKGSKLNAGEVTYKEPDSEFEEFVMSQIEAIGCEAIPQVGVAGYFIDIGVRHPDWQNGFILGVECDGASYHSSKSARDRDRLRQEVLEGLGWHLHRIWSTDWFENPRREGERLREVIKERVEALKRIE